MAYQKKFGNNSGNNGGGGFEFINFALPKADETAMKKWAETINLLGDSAIEELVSLGYKISCVIDTENECFVLTVIGTPNTPNNNKGMSSRSDSIGTCAIIALYKVTQVFESGVWHNPYKQSLSWG